jgi:hypothetical protein
MRGFFAHRRQLVQVLRRAKVTGLAATIIFGWTLAVTGLVLLVLSYTCPFTVEQKGNPGSLLGDFAAIEVRDGSLGVFRYKFLSTDPYPPANHGAEFWNGRLECRIDALHILIPSSFSNEVCGMWQMCATQGRPNLRSSRLVVPLLLPTGLLVPLAAMFVRRFARCRRPLSASMCPMCSYNLTGNRSGTCPECGMPIPEEVRKELVVKGPNE